MTPARNGEYSYDLVVDVYAQIVAATPSPGRAVLVAVDGVDGSGKTTFADRLAAAYDDAGLRAVTVHADDFLNPKSVRYRLGRSSPEGFFLDSIDLEALRAKVIDPVKNAEQLIIPRHFDHAADMPVAPEPTVIGPRSVVIVEGMFLHRDELQEVWDCSVFLDVPFEVSVGRMARRDGSHPDPAHVSNQRYVQGQKLYLSQCAPKERAGVVVDNSLVAPLRISRSGHGMH